MWELEQSLIKLQRIESFRFFLWKGKITNSGLMRDSNLLLQNFQIEPTMTIQNGYLLLNYARNYGAILDFDCCLNLVGFHLNYTSLALSLSAHANANDNFIKSCKKQNNENANFIWIDDWKCAQRTAISGLHHVLCVVYSTMFIDTDSKECFHLFYFLNNINVTRCSLSQRCSLEFEVFFAFFIILSLLPGFYFPHIYVCTHMYKIRYQTYRGSSALLTFADNDERWKSRNSWKMKFYLKIPLSDMLKLRRKLRALKTPHHHNLQAIFNIYQKFS